MLENNSDLSILINDIHTLKNLMVQCYCPIQRKNYYLRLIDKIDDLYQYSNSHHIDDFREKLLFTKEELSKYDGSNGMPAYVAVDGVIYDVSLVASFGGGTHFGIVAGNDLTKEFYDCHKSKGVLESLPVIGNLK